jgi:replicative DNA helicase
MFAAARDLEALADEAIWSERRKKPLLTVADILDDPAWSRPPEVLRASVAWWDDIQPFGGIERGSLVVLAAPPRCYKTSLMLFLAWQYAEAGHRVHYLAGEMTRHALTRRVVAMAGEVSPRVVMEPATDTESRAVVAGVERVRSLRDRLVFGRAPITVEQIASAADEADIAIVDYLQLIRPEVGDVAGGRAEELEGTMNTLLGVIQRGGTVIAAAALNRIGRGEASLSSIRGSSAIEYGATTVYATTERLVGLDPSGEREDDAIVYRCLKQREGEAIDLRFGIEPRLGPLPVSPPDRWS